MVTTPDYSAKVKQEKFDEFDEMSISSKFCPQFSIITEFQASHQNFYLLKYAII